MTSIEAANLQKIFQTKQQSCRAWRVCARIVQAAIQHGRSRTQAIVPDGSGRTARFHRSERAGKSTTIKILTGILHPTDGDAKILGYTPWKERQKLAYHIGTVFGQCP